MRTTFLRAAVAAGIVCGGTVTGTAHANGRFPAANQIIFSPSNPDVIMARTTFALVPSTDNGKTWSYLCEGSLGLPMTTYEDPELGFTASGALVAGLSAPTIGLDVSNDLGCSWSCNTAALANQQVVDTVVRPDTPHEVLALTGTYGIVDGGSYSQTFQSTDDGATWSSFGAPIDPAVAVTTIDVAANDPMRVYISGTRGYGATRTASLFTSTDAGQSWTEHPIPQFLGDQMGGETSVYIAAVDPTDADRVYVRSSGSADGGESRLYVTTDAGTGFTIAKDFTVEAAGLALIGELLGFALAPDGSEIYVGTKESGLWRANRSDMSFSVVNANVGVQCLATRQTASGPELWACGNEYKGPPGNPGNFIIGRSTDDGVTFTALLPTLTSLSGISQCGSSSSSDSGGYACGTTASTSQTCSCDEYTGFCSNIETVNACTGCGQGASDGGGDADGSAGAGSPSDAGGDATVEGDATVGGKTPSKASSSSCACVVVGREDRAGFLGAAGLGLAALVRRRRRPGRATGSGRAAR